MKEIGVWGGGGVTYQAQPCSPFLPQQVDGTGILRCLFVFCVCGFKGIEKSLSEWKGLGFNCSGVVVESRMSFRKSSGWFGDGWPRPFVVLQPCMTEAKSWLKADRGINGRWSQPMSEPLFRSSPWHGAFHELIIVKSQSSSLWLPSCLHFGPGITDFHLSCFGCFVERIWAHLGWCQEKERLLMC